MLCPFPGWGMSRVPASGYLDGEPAQAVLEVQRSLVFAEGNGVLGVQPLKLLLVVDYKNLPENTLVRIPENTSIGGGEKLEEETESLSLGWLAVGEGSAYYTPAFLLK